MTSQEDNCEAFFAENPAPKNLEKNKNVIKEFCDANAKQRIVLVTSGGTTIPFEKNTVRFIDNFSQGTRGSSSTEHFLEFEDYSVIFLYRSTTLRPFMRHFSNVNFLELLEIQDDNVQVDQDHSKLVKELLLKYQDIKKKNRLLEVPFTTLTDYLWLLKSACHELNHFGPKSMLYLAAAVSDFYIPNEDMVEHKIQSSDGAPSVQLKMVPKMLKPLVKKWVPQAFVVSFKLETDEKILVNKAKKALETYQHKIVVANLLHTRKQRVILVSNDDPEEEIVMSKEALESGREIEEKIIANLHQKHLQSL